MTPALWLQLFASLLQVSRDDLAGLPSPLAAISLNLRFGLLLGTRGDQARGLRENIHFANKVEMYRPRSVTAMAQEYGREIDIWALGVHTSALAQKTHGVHIILKPT